MEWDVTLPKTQHSRARTENKEAFLLVTSFMRPATWLSKALRKTRAQWDSSSKSFAGDLSLVDQFAL